MGEFLAMGGYAAFVWPAYLITAAVMAALFFTSLRAMRQSEAQVRALQDQAPRRARRRGRDTEVKGDA